MSSPLARSVAVLLLGAAATLCSGAAAAPLTPPIVFSADRAPSLSGEIYRLDADGRLVDLSNSPFTDTSVVVSPDGKSVAFRSFRGEGGVYVAAVDGSRVQQLETPPVGVNFDTGQVDLAWAPDSRRLAMVSGHGAAASLTVVGRGRVPVLLARKLVFQPAWSPDGRLVTGFVGRGINAYRATGGLAWRAPTSDFVFVPWSKRGLFLTVLHGRIRVLDERGRLRLSFPGRTAAWSPDGTRVASVTRDRVEVRSSAGRVLLRKRLKGLARRRTGMVWADSRRVVVFINRPIAVDIRTGRVTRVSNRYFGTRSADGRFVVETSKHGSQFAVSVVRISGSRAQTYGLVRGCFDDGGPRAAVQSLQFVPGRKSLVFESYCPEPPNDLYAVATDGTALTKLTGGDKQYYGPSWSPDGTHIAYTRFDFRELTCKGCPGSIWVADADGGNAHLLVPGNETSYESEIAPSWSPDGTRIMFTRAGANFQPTLFTVPAAGGTPMNLHLSGYASSWGPARVAWIDVGTNPTSLWTAKPDGSDRQELAEGEVASPAWAADGRLAYLEGFTTAVIVSGASTQRVHLPFERVTSLGWSPDGTRFVVGAQAAGTAASDIYTLRTDGTDVRRLTSDFDAASPSWR
jgi:Tol biopolymer transport system component